MIESSKIITKIEINRGMVNSNEYENVKKVISPGVSNGREVSREPDNDIIENLKIPKSNLENSLESLIVEKGIESLKNQIWLSSKNIKQAVLGLELKVDAEGGHSKEAVEFESLIVQKGIESLDNQIDRAHINLKKIIQSLGVNSEVESQPQKLESDNKSEGSTLHLDKQEKEIEDLISDCEEVLIINPHSK